MIEIFVILLLIAAALLFKMRIELDNIDDIKDAMNTFAYESAKVVKSIDHFNASMVASHSLGVNQVDGYLYLDTQTGSFCLVNKDLKWRLFKGYDILDVSIAVDNAEAKESNVYIENLHVIMHLDDMEYHTVRINCLPVRAKKNSRTYQEALATATKWHGVLTFLIHSEDEYRLI